MTPEEIVKDIAATIKESVQEAVSAVSKKYDEQVSLLKQEIESLKSAEKTLTVQEIKQIIEEQFKGIEVKEPDICHLETKLDEAIKSIPTPNDGKSPTPEEVAASMEHIFCKWALDFERKADHVLEKAIDRMPKPKDGKDALEIDDFDISIGEDGRTLTASLKRGESIVQKSCKLDIPLDMGIFSESKEYQKGDGVTYAGSFWLAQKDLPVGKPGGSDDWRLSVKRGRDGKEVVKLERPQTFKVGA